MGDRFFIGIVCFVVFAAVFSAKTPIEGSEYIQVPGVIHVHSTFSSGSHSLSELVALAESSGVEALILTDHDWVVMEYGLAPFRRLIKVRKERPSVLQVGVRDYLNEIDSLNAAQKKVIVIPGVQSSPFYYWTGNPVTGNLTAHDFSKELIAIGLSSPADYENLPVLHRICFSRICFSRVPGVHLFLCLAAVLMFAWGLWRNRPEKKAKSGLVVIGLAVLLLINYHPFSSSGYDPYHGPRGEAPFQDYIDYVHARGGMTFWSHPESAYSVGGRILGPIQMKTAPYPEALLQTKGYTGFGAIYGDTARAQNPGMHWDEVLTEFCAGFRDRPVWAIADADFHGTGKGEVLDRYLTVFLVREKTRPAVLDAMAQGRMYAVIKHGAVQPVLADFRATDGASGKTAVSGQYLTCGLSPEIMGHLSVSDGRGYDAVVSLIKNGKIMRAISERTPFEFHVRDADHTPGKSAYRLEARIQTVGRIISNPVFVTRPGGTMTTRNKR